MRAFRKRSTSADEYRDGRHRFEHWYRDSTVYFITARCRDRHPAFATEQAKLIFWDRFDHWTGAYGFVPWITTLLANHYHTLGYLKTGENLGPMMQRIHGSVAKLVNDLLPERRAFFWRETGRHDYFDGGACATNYSAAERIDTHSDKAFGLASCATGANIHTRASTSIWTEASAGPWNCAHSWRA